MAIPEDQKANFLTLCEAFKNGDVMLVECDNHVVPGLKTYVIAVVNHLGDGEVAMEPWAILFSSSVDARNRLTPAMESTPENETMIQHPDLQWGDGLDNTRPFPLQEVPEA